jgi:hypothetical protein
MIVDLKRNSDERNELQRIGIDVGRNDTKRIGIEKYRTEVEKVRRDPKRNGVEADWRRM